MLGRALLALILASLVAGLDLGAAEDQTATPPAGLHPSAPTAAIEVGRWIELFDGKSTAGWRGFKQQKFPERGWIVEGDALRHVSQAGGGDIITERGFEDFELEWEWRLGPKANGGIKYFITEARSAAIGHEYQLLDPEAGEAADGRSKHSTASFYDVLEPAVAVPLRRGTEYNQSRIVVCGDRVEHWLNGACVLRYQLGSASVKAAIAKSKFKNVEGFGAKFKTPILLQDHGGDVWFRRIRIRELKPNPNP